MARLLMKQSRDGLGALVLLCLLAPFGVALATTYRVSIGEALREVQVEIHLPGGAGVPDARADLPNALSGPKTCDGERLERHGPRLPPEAFGSCIRYRALLPAPASRRNPRTGPEVVLSNPGDWLWLPEEPRAYPLQVDLELPDGVSASVPWRQVGESRFLIDASPQSATAVAAFGRFQLRALPVAGGTLRVALVNGEGPPLVPERILPWLRTAASDVASVGGVFPSPSAQVIVQGVRARGSSPVPFGYVIRNGGEAVRFFVDPSRSLTDLEADWTATHEFAHLLLPYVREREKWLSEGFASYYQNVLLARRGAYTVEEGWQRLLDAFARAARIADPPTFARLHQRPFREVRLQVYWGGAAYALLADVALRESSGGDRSLDTVLAELADCCLPSAEVWTAWSLARRLDALAEAAIFEPLLTQFLVTPGMPDLEPLFRDLGLGSDDGRVRLTSGRLSGVRDAIMRASN